MSTATYGDLVDAAERDLASARRSRAGVTDYAGILAQLQRVVTAVARQLDIATPPASPLGVADQPAPRRATAEIREALCLASDHIGTASRQAERPARRVAVPSHCVARLGAAAEGLLAAYDLVRTHQVAAHDGVLIDRSDWAAVARSAPVAFALAQEAGRQSDQAGSWLGWLTTSPDAAAKLPQTALESMAVATRWLDAASIIAAKPGAERGVASVELLRGIPLWHVPGRAPLRSGETAADLCAGITSNAGRLRAIAFDLPEKAACSSPEISGPAWLETSRAAAVLSDLCAGVLTKLAQRAGTLALPGTEPDSFRRAVTTMAASCASWRQAATMWQFMTTDTQTEVTPATAELRALLLRLGRLTHAGRDWAPGSRSRPWLAPSALAPDQAAFVRVLGAVHQTADVLTRMAIADLAAFDIVSRARRFYMPNTLLWDDRAPTRNYAFAPHDRIQLLRDVCQVIVRESRKASDAIDDLAVHTGAPTRLLVLARRAVAVEAPQQDDSLDLAALQARLQYFTRPRHVRIPDAPSTHADVQRQAPREHPAGKTGQPPASPRARYGPFEARVRAASITDPGILVRAAALDRAGDELIQNAAKLAAQDTPKEAADPSPRPSQAIRPRPQRAATRRTAAR